MAVWGESVLVGGKVDGGGDGGDDNDGKPWLRVAKAAPALILVRISTSRYDAAEETFSNFPVQLRALAMHFGPTIRSSLFFA